MARTEASLEIPAITIEQLKLRIIGDSPLICHRWDEKAQQMILDKQQKKAVQGREAKDPVDCFVRSLYLMPGSKCEAFDGEEDGEVYATGRFGFPSIGFKAAAVRAATDVGMRMTDIRRAFHIDGELVEIEGVPYLRQDMVRIGMGTADVRFRGEFRQWAANVIVQVNSAVLSKVQLVNLFRTAGFGVGVGEWRPEKGG